MFKVLFFIALMSGILLVCPGCPSHANFHNAVQVKSSEDDAFDRVTQVVKEAVDDGTINAKNKQRYVSALLRVKSDFDGNPRIKPRGVVDVARSVAAGTIFSSQDRENFVEFVKRMTSDATYYEPLFVPKPGEKYCTIGSFITNTCVDATEEYEFTIKKVRTLVSQSLGKGIVALQR